MSAIEAPWLNSSTQLLAPLTKVAGTPVLSLSHSIGRAGGSAAYGVTSGTPGHAMCIAPIGAVVVGPAVVGAAVVGAAVVAGAPVVVGASVVVGAALVVGGADTSITLQVTLWPASS